MSLTATFTPDRGRRLVLKRERQELVLKAGSFGDLAVLDRDYFSVAEDQIQDITSVLTVVAGKPVHGSGSYEALAPPMSTASPDWPPVKSYGGYQARNGHDPYVYMRDVPRGCRRS